MTVNVVCLDINLYSFSTDWIQKSSNQMMLYNEIIILILDIIDRCFNVYTLIYNLFIEI